MLESIESTFEKLLADVAAFFQALNWSEILLDVVAATKWTIPSVQRFRSATPAIWKGFSGAPLPPE